MWMMIPFMLQRRHGFWGKHHLNHQSLNIQQGLERGNVTTVEVIILDFSL